jgi:hypothetical protein
MLYVHVTFLACFCVVWSVLLYFSCLRLIDLFCVGPPLWSEFLATDPEVPGSILDTSRFSKQRVWNGVHSAS